MDSNPIEVAEYAFANQINEEPAFSWWVPYILKKRKRIINKLKNKYWRTTHKYGVRIPKTTEEALRLDRINGNTLWQDAIEKEMKKVSVAWREMTGVTVERLTKGHVPELNGYQRITCHMIFDVKMDFTRKARFVAGGHTMVAPASLTFSSVVSRDSVRIAFLYAALNGLDVLSCDVGNAYLYAPCREKIYFIGGLECGEQHGKVLVVTKALYGLKSSGASWRAMFAGTITELGFEATQADPDVWRRRSVRKGGTEYWELLLVYVDDVLCVAETEQAGKTMEAIGQVYDLKDTVRPPVTYLGAQIERMQLQSGKECWAFSSEKFIKNAINTIEDLLLEDGRNEGLKSTAATPFPHQYRPELDVTKELDADRSSRFRQMIGILRWAIELGRIDIYTETALLSQHSAMPREGHLETAYHIFSYLKKRPKLTMAFDPDAEGLEHSPQDLTPWRDFYGEVVEDMPPRMPEPLGNDVFISCFVDANHAGNMVTRRSHTGILIFVNNAPILWYSKKQNTVETSTFGSEFVALKVAKEMISALRYKLRMFGIPLGGPAYVHCDNRGVVMNTTRPESTLSRKHQAINYHAVREAVAAGIIWVIKEDTLTNLADLFTKVLPGPRRNQLLSRIVYGSWFWDGNKVIVTPSEGG